MRGIANILLLIAVATGLVLPVNAGWRHEASCPDEECHDELLAAWEEFVSSDATCSGHGHNHGPSQDHHHEHEEDGGNSCPHRHSHDGEEHEHEGGDSHHHHQHSCPCGTAPAWIISDGELLALHPPRPGSLRPAGTPDGPPESPVYLLERPPIA